MTDEIRSAEPADERPDLEPVDEVLDREDAALTAASRPYSALSWGDDQEPDPADTDPAMRLLGALRRDVGEGLDPADVVPLRRRRRLAGRSAAAAAVAAVVLSAGGVAAAAAGAPPGSFLYPIREAVTGHHAPAPGLVALTRLLDNAEKALDAGRLQAAGALLDDCDRRVGAIHAADLSTAQQSVLTDDVSRLAALRARLAAALSATHVSGTHNGSHGAPGAVHSSQAPGRAHHPTPGATPGTPGNSPHPHPTGPPAGHGPNATPGTSGDRGQPVDRVGSSSAASSTPSANPRA